VGIALYHLKVATEHFGEKTQFIFDETAKKNAPEEYDYIVSLKVE